jgi:hypothetical protein
MRLLQREPSQRATALQFCQSIRQLFESNECPQPLSRELKVSYPSMPVEFSGSMLHGLVISLGPVPRGAFYHPWGVTVQWYPSRSVEC